VSLQGVEVVQAVQDMSGSVPLIAGKTTWVRVYLDKNNGTRPLTASLKAQRGTTTLSLNPVAPITVDATENLTLRRQNFSKSLNFAVPAAMIGPGTTIFALATPTDMSPQHKTIICDNCGNPTQVSFSNMPPLVVRLIGLTYQFQPTPGAPQQTATPRPIDFTLLQSWLGRAYPVSQVISSQTTAPVNFKPNFDGTTSIDCTNADAQLSAIRAVDMAQLGADNRTHYLPGARIQPGRGHPRLLLLDPGDRGSDRHRLRAVRRSGRARQCPCQRHRGHGRNFCRLVFGA
jgi:hypothetical protein